MTNELSCVVDAVNNSCHCLSFDGSGESVAQSVREWIVAVGSIAVVVVAVFQAWIKGFWKAKISLSISSHSPNFIIEKGDETIGCLWVAVRNSCSFIDAEAVRVSIERIIIRSKSGDKDSYKDEINIHPTHLLWSAKETSREISLQIAANSSEYAQVAKIVCYRMAMQNNYKDNPPNIQDVPTLVVVSRDQEFPIKSDFQDVLLKLRIAGDTVKTEYGYIQILWQGRNRKHLEESASKFLSCKNVSEREFKVLTGEKS